MWVGLWVGAADSRDGGSVDDISESLLALSAITVVLLLIAVVL